MSIIPSPWAIAYAHRHFTGTKDSHGNKKRITDPPEIRMVMSIAQPGRFGASREVISAENLLRDETALMMAVADPTIYYVDDSIWIFPEFDKYGCLIPGSGIAYWIMGTPADDRQGPWPDLLAMFGGVVRCKRVSG